MDRSWLIRESAGLNPHWLGYIKIISVKNSYMLLCNILSNIFPATGSKDIGRWFFKFCLSPFLCNGTTLAFFHSVGDFPITRHDLKINFRGLQKETPQILIVRILVIS